MGNQRIGRIRAGGVAISVVVVGALLALAAAPASAATSQGAVIQNGTVQLGVNADGSLNYDCQSAGDPVCPSPSVEGVSPVGLRFQPLNLESTSDGCLCEGWGAADAGTGLSGGGTVDNTPTGNTPTSTTTVDSFTSPSSTEAVSTVTITDSSIPGAQMQVVQDYHTTPLTPNVFVDSVKITNTGSTAFTDLLYRRDMDWDIEPTAFSEWVTIQGTTPELKFDSDDGFAPVNALNGPSYIDSEVVCGSGYTGPCQFTDLGSGGTFPTVTTPDDHGGVFDFAFGALPVGASKSFTVVYGAADNENDMTNALNAAGAQVYSLGESNCTTNTPDPSCESGPPDVGPRLGEPATFGFAFVTTTADVAITKKDSPDPAARNKKLTYDIKVTNKGPNQAAGITVDDPLPAGVKFVSAKPGSGGTCTGTTTVSCSLPSLSGGASTHITIVVKPTKTGTLKNTATVSTLSNDPSKANNSATAKTEVISRRLKCQGKPATIVGSKRDDVIKGTKKADVITGRAGDDVIKGLKGNDRLCGKKGHDRIIGGAGKDEIHGGAGRDNARGSGGDDLVRGGKVGDKLAGQGGDDTVRGGNGKDKMSGGPGKDLLKGHGGKDSIKGNGGNDLLGGGSGFDHLNGGGGQDRCSPGPGGAKRVNCEA